MGILDFWRKPEPVDVAGAVKDAVRDVVREEMTRYAMPQQQKETQEGLPFYPYAVDNPFNYRVTTSPKRLPGKKYSTIQLRAWANGFDPLRSIIEYLKSEAASIPVSFVPRPGFEDQNLDAKIAMVTEWIGDCGPLGGEQTRRVFESKILDDALVLGSYAVWYERDRLLRPISCLVLDASTIKPRLDGLGWPDRENPFEQWVMGVMVQQFQPGQIRMDGLYPNTELPYFVSPVEWAVRAITAGINVDDWNDKWLTSPNVRAGDTISLPEDWTPEQIAKFTELWQLRGQTAEGKQGVQFLPSGSAKLGDHTRKDQDFAGFEIQIIRRLCALFGIQAASIGYVGEQYKVTQGDSMNASQRVGLGRLLQLRKEFYDDLLRRLGCPELEARDVQDDTEQKAKQIDLGVKACGGAFKTINEVRAENGLPPVEGGDVINGTVKEPEPDEEVPDDEPEDENEGVSEA